MHAEAVTRIGADEECNRVLPMSMPKTEGHSANVVEVRGNGMERKLLSMSKGGSNNQRLLGASKRKQGQRASSAGSLMPAGIIPGSFRCL